MRATYSPEDNKIRLYPGARLDDQEYARVKAVGFRWAPQQELFYATWNPNAEDLAMQMAGEIEDEDSTLAERAEARAERFDTYADNRRRDGGAAMDKASAIGQRFEGGQPILVGHHSEKRARKDREKMDRTMRQAVNAFATADYWTRRAQGALSNADYKERPDVRQRRIKTLEAEQRKQQRYIDQYGKAAKAWEKVKDDSHDLALHVANVDGTYVSRCFPLADFPRDPPASQYEGPMGIWSALNGNVINAGQARDIMLKACANVVAGAQRWVDHYANRIAYEKVMLGEAGGGVTDKKGPEKGGAILCWASPCADRMKGWAYIDKVNKVTVSIRRNFNAGGRLFRQNMPFDKIEAVMTAAEVQEARDQGRLVELPEGHGFFLAKAPEPKADPAPAPEPVPDDRDKAKEIEQMRQQMNAAPILVSPTLYPTPDDVAERMVMLAGLDRMENPRVLEPSAGTGRLIDAALRLNRPMEIEAVEVVPRIADALRERYKDRDLLVFNGDFMEYRVESADEAFDVILMNPPFNGGLDIKHIKHAATMLKPGGRIVAIAANGPRQLAALQPMSSYWAELPAKTFAHAGTNVRTVLMIIEASND